MNKPLDIARGKILLIDGSTSSPQVNQIILVDKEAGWTSFDVVAKVRSKLRAQSPGLRAKVGHAGTLDPFATGLLIVLVGDETKNQDKYMKLDKEYEATLKLGYVSSTGDPEGKIAPYPSLRGGTTKQSEIATPASCGLAMTKKEIENVLKKFTGELTQTPPKYSAIKIKGKKAYELARAGQEFQLKPRKITIHDIIIVKYDPPMLHLTIRCSSGTYIRTLAEDIGKELGTGAYLTALRRTKIGNFDIKDAQT